MTSQVKIYSYRWLSEPIVIERDVQCPSPSRMARLLGRNHRKGSSGTVTKKPLKTHRKESFTTKQETKK